MNPTTITAAAADDEYDQYRLTKDSDTFTVEDCGTGILTITGTNLGLTFKSWMNAGFTIVKTGVRKIGDDGLTYDEAQLMFEGKKIQAIKAVRERTMLGLADAKALVDGWHGRNQSRLHAANPGMYR